MEWKDNFQIYGANLMGRMLMELRAYYRLEFPNWLKYRQEACVRLIQDTNDLILHDITNPPATNARRRVYNFWSRASESASYLSNFAESTEFWFRGYRWKSSEHAFQAFFLFAEKERIHFALGGKYCKLSEDGAITPGAREIFKKKFPRITEKAREEKINRYGAKKVAWDESGERRAMPGILAKFATSYAVGRALGLEYNESVGESKCAGEYERKNIPVAVELFLEILKCKFDADNELRGILLGTEDAILIEFSARCEYNFSQRKEVELWSGFAVELDNADRACKRTKR